MESWATLLLILPQSKLVENTTKFIQNKIDSEKFGKNWLCLQNLVSSMSPKKHYKSQDQYFLTENLPQLYSVKMKTLHGIIPIYTCLPL